MSELTAPHAPFTVAQARDDWQSSRRVAVLLELLDRRGVTRRLPDGSRLLGQTGPARGRLEA